MATKQKAAKPRSKSEAKPRGKAAAAKPAAPKKESKKVKAGIHLDDPSTAPPLVFKSRVTETSRSKVLSKMVENVRKSIDLVSERSKKRPVYLFTPAMLRRNIVGYDELSFQYMLDSVGIRYPMAIEIVAPESIGSTTFVFDWISRLLDMGCYSVYCECEGKPADDRWIKRIMDRDPKMAVAKLNSITFAEARTLAQLDETLRKSVADLRKRCDDDPETKGNPIFFFADPWGALMSKDEAKGNSGWGLAANAKKEAPKDTTDGSNFGHAKHAQGMARWLPSFLEANNCVMVFVNKQNDKIDMGAKTMPSYMTPSPLKNDTRVGGRALRRLCAYRFTMLKGGDIRAKEGEKAVYGHNIRMMLIKSSYGPRDRTCEFSIFFDQHRDTEDYQAPALSYDERTANWFAANKFLGVTVTDGLYSCHSVGVTAVPAAELMNALRQHPDQLEFLGAQLNIEGYVRSVAAHPPLAVAIAAAADDDDDDSDEDAEGPIEEAPGVVP